MNQELVRSQAQSVEKLMAEVEIARERMQSVGLPQQSAACEELRRSDVILDADEVR